MLSEYKAQQSCERGFSFLKNPWFLADSVFLKSPERIEALAMIMGLCLLVYTLAQREIRAALKSLNYTVKNQLGKAINNPTMRWIFQCFQSVHLVTFQEKREFYNLTSEMKYILLFLPENCRNYYRYISWFINIINILIRPFGSLIKLMFWNFHGVFNFIFR